MIPSEEKLAEFDATHTGEDGYVVDPTGVWAVYSDGARRSLKSYGELSYAIVEPPLDPKEVRRWQIVFWETRLAELVDQFERKRAACQNTSGDDYRFRGHMDELRKLQTAVRSARSKLSHLQTAERGFTATDVDRAWDCWEQFSQAIREESEARRKYESGLLKHSSEGILEKLKHALDQAQQQSRRAMERWNSFEPAEARSIVSEELDSQRRAERERELQEIEV